jgi:oxygen-dependent protoporphyrinogen oxidase
MHPVPEGFLLLAPSRIWPFVTSKLFSWPAKMRMALDLVLPRKEHGETGDESLADFVRRRFGREALERVAQPMVGGIYTADPAELSLRATMPRFLDMENRHRSIIKAMRAEMKRSRPPLAKAGQRGSGDAGARYSLFVSFRHGMATLTDTLASRLPPESLHTGSPVAAVQRAEANTWRVKLADGERIEADSVILACPAHATARLLESIDAELASELAAIRYASSATMTLAFRSEQVANVPDGFGFVVPALERRRILAVTVSSLKFENRAPAGHVLLRAFLGGAMHPHVYAMPDDDLREAVVQDLRELMGVRGEPLLCELYRWPNSMPQYPVGHLDRVGRIRQRLREHSGLLIAGNALGGVGVPDCIASAEAAAEQPTK